MTRSLAVNENNDIHAINGRLQIAEGLQAVLQTCERVMKTVRGELIYSQTRGVTYFESAFGPAPNVVQFEASARAQISAVADVIEIEEFTAEITGGSMVYSATIRTTFGTGVIDGNL